MERLLIPASRVNIARLGFGCARLFGGRELKASAKLIEAALRAGITHFDTAPAYGSEDVLGEVLAGSSEVTIATKIGVARMRSASPSRRQYFGTIYRRALRPVLARAPRLKNVLLRLASAGGDPPMPVPRLTLTRDQVLCELADSLRRLRRASADLYLLHEPEGIEITDELRETFGSLQAQGVIGAHGLAFGGERDSSARFGTATQCRYARTTAGHPHNGIVHIYHGILRYRTNPGNSARDEPRPRELIRSVLAGDPNCAIVFSASSASQIIDAA